MAKAAAAAILLIAALLGFMSASLADQGIATYSTAGTPSACIIGNQDEGTMTAAASDELFNNGAGCGTMYKVTCTGGINAAVPNPCNAGASVTVTIVDLCPSPGCTVTFDLSQEAFSTIANLDADEILVDYELA